MQKALKGWLKKIRKWHQRNKTTASRKNVQHHYDLSNDFYKLFLDEDMQYSCGYWPSLDITLEEAQRLKKAHIATKLHLKPGMKHVPETFDRVVSVGMFEHVGVAHYLEYFSKIKELLTDDGAALIHSIGRKGGPGTTGAWIRKYIFPGGYSPALSETFAEIEKQMFDEKFCRMWEFYLIISELSFRVGKHMNFQIQLAKEVGALPMARDYMMDGERKLS